MKIDNLLHRSTVIILVLFLLTTCSVRSKGLDEVETEANQPTVSQLKVVGNSLTDEAGNQIKLKGVSLGWHNWWPRFYNNETVNWLKEDWNCNLIRAAIGAEPQNAYIENPALAMECLYNVVDAAIENDMYVIVDWHSHSINQEEAKQFFKTVATKYKGNPNIIYELFNEPVDQSWEDIKNYSETLIKIIRDIDPENIILVGCPHWDQDIHLPADNPITGYNNLMYTVHFYAGSHKQYLRDRCDYALGKGLPIFVSECAGMNADGDGLIDYAEWELWQQWLNKNNISWVAWSVADKNETCSMIKDRNAPISHWTDSNLKEWGKEVRNTLRKK